MNKHRIIGLVVVVMVLGLLSFAVYSLFEIQPVTRTVPPSREARINEYLALDRWLGGMGISLRILDTGSLLLFLEAEERQIFIQSSLFHWTDEGVEYLSHWIREGGTLFLVLDYSQGWVETEPLSLLEQFGIRAEIESVRSTFYYDTEYPNYDQRVSFTQYDEAALALKDRSGRARLVQQRWGAGKLIVSGSPYFLLSGNLDEKANSRLAWTLFSGEGDWLFIRGTTRVQGLLGSLFRQGNFQVLIVSALVLLVIGFWAVIPGFGLVRGDEEKPGKALRERFLAEGRFLKSYGALDFYHKAYMKEIKRRLAYKEGLRSEEEIQRLIFELLGRPVAAPLAAQDFIKMISDYKTLLERI